MSDQSAIQWTDATWNPVSGCTRVSPECDNCYAVGMTHRLEKMGQVAKYGGLTVLNPRGERHFNGVVRCDEKALAIPLGWKKPRRIFVNSMSDLFHKEVPFEFIDRVFAVMALCPQHTFQVLTKRPERMAEYLNSSSKRRIGPSVACDIAWEMCEIGFHQRLADGYAVEAGQIDCQKKWPLANVWLGTSCGTQATAEAFIPHLARVPAAVRFLSMEPLLGPVDLTEIQLGNADTADVLAGQATDIWENGRGGKVPPYRARHWAKIHWVIVGGESGGGARACDVSWIRSIVRQCRETSTPVFVKQLGKRPADREMMTDHLAATMIKDPKGGDMAEWPEDLRVREMPRTGGAV